MRQNFQYAQAMILLDPKLRIFDNSILLTTTTEIFFLVFSIFVRP